MPVQIPDAYADLVKPETRAFAALGLLFKDGTPQVTPMWFDYEDGRFVFNTARGRVKARIMRRHPPVAFAIVDPANPYRYLQVRGRVGAHSEEDAFDRICHLNEKYRGNRNYPRRPGEVRVTFWVQPEHVSTWG